MDHMKVLFVYHNSLGDSVMPQSIAVLGGMMRDNGIDSKLFDTTFYRDINGFDYQDRLVREDQKKGGYKKVEGYGFTRESVDLKIKFREEVESYHPDLVAATSTSFEFNSILDFVVPTTSEMKIPFIVGGSHVTVVPERALSKKGLDVVCIGEGEMPLLELVKRMERKKYLYDIPSLWFNLSEGEIIKNQIGLPLKMDDIPESNWDIIDERHRIRPFEGEIKRYGWFEASRGCPFSCSYCINSKLHTIERQGGFPPGTYRFFSPKEIIRRMKAKKDKEGYNHIGLIDENTPNMPIQDLELFSKLFKEQIDCGFYTQARPECFTRTPIKAKLMADMGCKMIGMGVESGNEQLRKNVLNRPMKDGVIEKAFEIVKDAGMMTSACYIIGFPTETEEMIQQTIDLHRKIKPDRFAVRFLHPFPGTPIRDLCVREGYMPDNYEDLNYNNSYFMDPVLNLPSPPHPTKERLKELKKEFENY